MTTFDHFCQGGHYGLLVFSTKHSKYFKVENPVIRFVNHKTKGREV